MKNLSTLLFRGMAILMAVVLFVGVSHAYLANASSWTAEGDGSSNDDTTVSDAPNPVITDPSTDPKQDTKASVITDPSTDLKQDTKASFSSDSSTDLNQDTPATTTPVVVTTTYTIAVTSSNNGSLDTSGHGAEVSGYGYIGGGLMGYTLNNGASLTFAIVPYSGYQVADVSVDGTSIGTTTTYTFSDVTANHTLAVTFEVIPVSPVSPVSTPTTTPTPAAVVSYSGGSSGSSSSSSGGSPVTIATTTATTTVPATATSSCPLITSYLKFGANNDRSQVASLQAFLKDSQNLSVDVNGIFDQKTLDAVKAFQSKYMSQTMGPWGATQSSGYVYITTTKKINEIACNSPLTLNPSELAIIDSYKAQQNNATASATSTVGAVGAVGPIVPNLNASTTPLIGQVQNANGTANTASVVNASILQRLWGFIKNLF